MKLHELLSYLIQKIAQIIINWTLSIIFANTEIS